MSPDKIGAAPVKDSCSQESFIDGKTILQNCSINIVNGDQRIYSNNEKAVINDSGNMQAENISGGSLKQKLAAVKAESLAKKAALVSLAILILAVIGLTAAIFMGFEPNEIHARAIRFFLSVFLSLSSPLITCSASIKGRFKFANDNPGDFALYGAGAAFVVILLLLNLFKLPF